MFERLRNRYVIKGKVVMDAALHIGSGEESFERGALVVKDAYGKPYIPGSSFKGIIRSTVERIIPYLDGFKTCALIKGADCATVNEVKMDQLKERLKGDEEGEPIDLLCDTCKLFGSTAVASKVKISDLYVTEPWIGLFEKRDGVGIDRDTETSAEGAKFEYEVVPSQTEFNFEMVCENLDEGDKLLLSIGLREMQSGYVSIGGNRSRGLGAFQLIIDEVALLNFEDRKSFMDYLASQKLEKIELVDFIEEGIKYLQQRGGQNA
ncbi:MAG: hypothetical protein DDT23_00587 [candidate division WS2 bacterium]|nr:hypothetical protein [Candidatus Lithacetigena glycinireducens]